MRHIPNILSTFRILLIPFFVALMLHDRAALAGVVLVVSGITDLLDGFHDSLIQGSDHAACRRLSDQQRDQS